jgi:hypothetical protein
MGENRSRSLISHDQVGSHIHRSCILAGAQRHGEAGRTNAEETLHLQLGFA